MKKCICCKYLDGKKIYISLNLSICNKCSQSSSAWKVAYYYFAKTYIGFIKYFLIPVLFGLIFMGNWSAIGALLINVFFAFWFIPNFVRLELPSKSDVFLEVLRGDK